MASSTGTLYIGSTNNLQRRVTEHKSGFFEGFSKRYGCKRLIYFEEYEDITDAIVRERQLKKWNRKKKENAIALKNPRWFYLFTEL